MLRGRWPMLFLVTALAAGELTASQFPNFYPLCPALAIFALIMALLGFGCKWRFWPVMVTFILGAALYLHAAADREEYYRKSPWMRNARNTRQEKVDNLIKRDISRRIGLGLERNYGAATLNRAILLGERRYLPRELKRAFVDSGTVHLFAISGLHVMIVAQTIAILISLFFVSTRIAGALALPVVWGYVIVIGMPPSAVRAALMASFYYLAPVFWRRPDAVRSWVLAFLVMHVISPLIITDVGSQLSFVVMLALILAGRAVRNCESSWRVTVWMGFAAWAAGVPIAAQVFGRVTPGGILSNLMLMSSATFSVGAGVLGVLMSYVSESIAAHFNNLASVLIMFMTTVATFVASLPFANFEVETWNVWDSFAWYAALGLGIWLIRSIYKRHNLI